MGCLRYGRPLGDYRQLVDAYGYDPRGWGGQPVLSQVHALNVLTAVFPLIDTHTGVHGEGAQRIEALGESRSNTR